MHIKLAHVKCSKYSTYFRLNESTCFFQTCCLVKCRPCKRNLKRFVEMVLQGVKSWRAGGDVEHALQEIELTCNDKQMLNLRNDEMMKWWQGDIYIWRATNVYVLRGELYHDRQTRRKKEMFQTRSQACNWAWTLRSRKTNKRSATCETLHCGGFAPW